MAIYDDWNPDEVVELYINQGYTRQDLADYFGVSKSTVNRALVDFGITKGRGRGRQIVPETMEEPEFAEGEFLSPTREDIEFRIRSALSDIIERAPTGLIDKIPVGYDPDDDLWVVNDYKSIRKGHDLPMEVHIKYNTETNRFEVVDFEIRGKSDRKMKSAFQSRLS